MNTKWNLLMVIAVLAMLVGGNVGRAQAQSVITFSPESLPNAMVGIYYQEVLSVSGATQAGTWSYVAGTLPLGMSVGDYGNDGKGAISGVPEQLGTFTFSVFVRDYDGSVPNGYTEYSHAYTLVVEKGTTTVLMFDSINPTTYGDGFEIKAHSHFTDLSYPPGTFAFYLDGSLVTGCDALPVDESNLSTASCWFPGTLPAGDHEIRALYSPIDDVNYNQSEATVTHTVGYKIDGTLFRDANMNGIRDDGETTLGAFFVGSYALCDSNAEKTAYASPDGTFSIPNLSPNIEYCLQFIDAGAKFVQTTPAPTERILLDENKVIPVGVYFINVWIGPDDLPAGEKGVPYEQQITVGGGIPPYTITVDSTQSSLPDGISFDPLTNKLSGTPTQAGVFSLVLNAEDAEGNAAYVQKYSLLIKGNGVFEFISSPNPSAVGEEVTFTLSATGDAVVPGAGAMPPIGTVSFYDGTTAIDGCSGIYLNVDLVAEKLGDFPAQCKTNSLVPGTRKISAVYTDPTTVYGNATLTLDQQVGLTISPDTLPDGTYAADYFQQLTIGGGSGSYTILWVSDTLPKGIILWPATGELKGQPGETGTFTFSVQVQDNNDLAMTTVKKYTLVVGKESLDVTVWTEPVISKSGEGFDIWAASSPFISGVGTFAFYLDDSETPILGCEAVPLVNYAAYCQGGANLATGEHTVKAVLTPIDNWANLVNAATGTATHTVGYGIGGTVFEDLNKDGVFGTDEPLTGVEWTIQLDKGCNGTVDQATVTASDGTYEFAGLQPGLCYRVSTATQPVWIQTVTLSDITSLSQDVTDLNIGAYPAIYLGANSDAPRGDIGVPYSFQYPVAGGGTAPYTFTLVDNEYDQPSVLPTGLTLSESGLLSGTPTEGGVFHLGLLIKDANGALSGNSHTILYVTLDGHFTLTSSSNPSIPDEPVTFTLAATGDHFDPGMGAVPPIGYVTFLDGNTPIEGCAQVFLNVILDEYGQPTAFGDYPATCTVGTLAEGTHTITATFTDPGLAWYHNATVTLNQVVNPATSADLSITKTDSKDPVRPGAQLAYTLTVKNLGPDAAQSITLVDTLDRNTKYVSVAAPRGWSCRYVNYAVTCTGASLASGSSATIKITVAVSKTARLGKDLVNNAAVSSATYDPVIVNNSVVQKTLVSR